MRFNLGIRKKIRDVTEGGEILLIVPPFGSIEDVSLGVHILQAVARKNGHKADILYLNMLLASIMGIEPYKKVGNAPLFWMLGERLFARSAYGLPPLGRYPECCADEAMAIGGRDSKIKLFHYRDNDFNLNLYLQMERTCKSFLDEAIYAISSMNYRIVGCNTMHPGMTNCSIALLNGVKRLSPETVTIMGGSNCEGGRAKGIASLESTVDYIFSGEGETAFLNLLGTTCSKGFPARGILTGESGGGLDGPRIDYDAGLNQAAHFLGERARDAMNIWYETSRGCMWAEKRRCKFCGVPQRSHKRKKIKTVVRDLKNAKESYPDKMVYITDDTLPLIYHEELASVFHPKEEFPAIACSSRTDLDLRGMLNLKGSKIVAVVPGIESFSTNLLKLMGKGVAAKQNIMFLRNAKSVGIYCDWFMLWGFPGDKITDYVEVLRVLLLLRHLQPPRELLPMFLMRFSPYFDHRLTHRIQKFRPWNVFSMIYPDGAAIDEFANYYIAEFPCESYENPEIIKEIADTIDLWKKNWRKTNLVMKNIMGGYSIYDNRGLFSKKKNHLLNDREAREIMTSREYEKSEVLDWAVTEKLGVVVDSWYVPLVTATPDILLEFE